MVHVLNSLKSLFAKKTTEKNENDKNDTKELYWTKL